MDGNIIVGKADERLHNRDRDIEFREYIIKRLARLGKAPEQTVLA